MISLRGVFNNISLSARQSTLWWEKTGLNREKSPRQTTCCWRVSQQRIGRHHELVLSSQSNGERLMRKSAELRFVKINVHHLAAEASYNLPYILHVLDELSFQCICLTDYWFAKAVGCTYVLKENLSACVKPRNFGTFPTNNTRFDYGNILVED